MVRASPWPAEVFVEAKSEGAGEAAVVQEEAAGDFLAHARREIGFVVHAVLGEVILAAADRSMPLKVCFGSEPQAPGSPTSLESKSACSDSRWLPKRRVRLSIASSLR